MIKVLFAMLSIYALYFGMDNPVLYLVILGMCIVIELIDKRISFLVIIITTILVFHFKAFYFTPLLGLVSITKMGILAFFIPLLHFESDLFLTYITMFMAFQYEKLDYDRKISDSMLDKWRSSTLTLEKKYLLDLKLKERTSKLEERERISRELHDVIGHTISSSIVQIEAIKMLEHDSESMDRLLETLKNGMERIRYSLHDLHSSAKPLKDELLKISSHVPSLQTTIIVPEKENMSIKLKKTIINIYSELLSNSVKHGFASQSELIINKHSQFYTVQYKDNGRGFTKLEYGLGLLEIDMLSEGTLRVLGDGGFSLYFRVKLDY